MPGEHSRRNKGQGSNTPLVPSWVEMSEPTEEQIMAAAIAIANHPDFDGAPLDYLSVANAALTAAAALTPDKD